LNRRVSVLNNWKHVTPTHVAEAVGELLKEYIDPIRVRLAALEAVAERVTQLEKSDEQKSYQGVFRTGESYVRHNSCTHHGSLWIAERDDPGVPGIDDNGWRLAVKRGKDGRGAS
jgi:hypothetical protein